MSMMFILEILQKEMVEKEVNYIYYPTQIVIILKNILNYFLKIKNLIVTSSIKSHMKLWKKKIKYIIKI